MNIAALMKQAQEMQKKVQKAQDEMQNQEFEGSAGGGMVKIIVNGAGLGKKIDIDPSLLQESEKEILEDLIIAALNDAKKKTEESSSEIMKSATSGLNLPKGFGF
jgi:DNA-binding YbaB/EbfC family protein